jgi:flavin reductase (DIM6/NTAB) family NADH-FMN oxidoreductase RutF
MAISCLPPEADRFRKVLGLYPTGVSVVTGLGPDGYPAGLAVGTFTSVSLDPLLVGFLPARSSRSWPKIRATGSFCINVLGEHQLHVCQAFAISGGDKFEGLEWHPAGSGCPVLDGAVTWIDCKVEAVHPAGDHDFVIGRVLDFDGKSEHSPLLFLRGGYGRAALDL